MSYVKITFNCILMYEFILNNKNFSITRILFLMVAGFMGEYLI